MKMSKDISNDIANISYYSKHLTELVSKQIDITSQSQTNNQDAQDIIIKNMSTLLNCSKNIDIICELVLECIEECEKQNGLLKNMS